EGINLAHVLNPLQHTHVVDGLSRETTGEKLSYESRLVGGMIWGVLLKGRASPAAADFDKGAVTGGAFRLAEAELEKKTGKDMGAHIIERLSKRNPPPQNNPAADGSAAATQPRKNKGLSL